MLTSLLDPDWSREEKTGPWCPGASLLKAHRSYSNLKNKSGLFARLGRSFYVLKYRFWSVITGADIPLGTSLGGGLVLPHPNGIVIHPEAKIGVNCLIMQGVTIGTNIGKGAPLIEAGCDLSPGAKVLGPITIGARAMIGANAVVTKNVPPLALAIGVPAKICMDWKDRRKKFIGQEQLLKNAN
ncbi:MAG: serine acetyltransferase [Pseudomonadota bacterium]